ncbi:MAG: PASTA domain-containing protein, partial [Verrucomicrobiota bacterium]
GQNPAGGSNVDPGTPVSLVVSLGPAPVNVPDVVGNSQAVAQQTIIDATLSVGTISEEFSDTVAAGNVISQNPVGGTSVPPGTAVDLLISLGPQPTVPDVIGQQQAAAEAAIVAANLAVGAVTEQFSDTFAAGSVLEQNPVGGTRANPGTAVDLVVSLGPRPTVPDVVGFEEAAAIVNTQHLN